MPKKCLVACGGKDRLQWFNKRSLAVVGVVLVVAITLPMVGSPVFCEWALNAFLCEQRLVLKSAVPRLSLRLAPSTLQRHTEGGLLPNWTRPRHCTGKGVDVE